MAAAGTCNLIACGDGYMDIETVLLSLFAKDSNGCTGLKIVQLTETACTNLTDLVKCGEVITVEQALKMAIVDDGCGGFALGVYFISALQ